MKKTFLKFRVLSLLTVAAFTTLVICLLTACSDPVCFNASDFEPGLYNQEGELIVSWKELVADSAIYKKDENSLKNVTELLESSKNLSKGTILVIGEGVEQIGDRAFAYCTTIQTIIMPNSITDIGKDAFYNCTSLETIVLSESLENIGEAAFTNCKKLTSVSVPTSLLKVGAWAFSGCDSLKYNEYDNAYYLGNSTNPYVILIEAKNTLIQTCEINPSTKIIYTAAFIDCPNLREINIPNSITDIGEHSFSGCASLERIFISDSVASVGNYAFSDCNSLVYNTHDNAYYLGNENNPYLILVKAKDKNITSCEIYPETKLLYFNAFSGCERIKQIDIPNSVTAVGQGVFSFCEQLSVVIIPDSITQIEADLFVGCHSLAAIAIPNSVTQIGKYAFNACTSLTYIIIPNSVTIIEEGAFHSCRNLFDVVLSSNTISIGAAAFYNCTSLTSIILPDKLESIQMGAFAGCDNLTSITIHSNVEHVGGLVFDRCYLLTRVSFAGTKNKWSSLSWDYTWNSGSAISTIICSDGEIYIK